jgi:hypothetical protein
VELRVSLEVDPGVFDAEELSAIGARIVQYHHMGWLSLRVDPDRLEALRRLPGVQDASPVWACEEELADLAPAPEWSELARAECADLLAARLELGRWNGRTAFLRQTLEVRQKCFVRSHRTDAQDIVVLAQDARGGERVVCRHSDGLRDRSAAGMHDLEQGDTLTAAMWIGHLAPGAYRVQAGIDGWVRVRTRPTPFTYAAEFTVPGAAVRRPA